MQQINRKGGFLDITNVLEMLGKQPMEEKTKM